MRGQSDPAFKKVCHMSRLKARLAALSLMTTMAMLAASPAFAGIRNLGS